MPGSWQIEMLWRCTSCGGKNRGRALKCASCGGPKDGSETYELPEETSRAAAVDDAELLRQATAGENWRCAFCASDQRRYDGACAQCGAGRPEARASGSAAVAPLAGPLAGRVRYRRSGFRVPSAASIVVAVLVMMLLGLAMRRRAAPPRVGLPNVAIAAFDDVDGEVTERAWRYTVTVERHQLWPFEGFAESKPADAIDVKALGERHHHDDSVPDGFETKTWTEQVGDGYDTQSYTANEACGQTCTQNPQTCKDVCTSNKNGFATCNKVCSGGGQSCAPKYCSVTKTRQVPRYKTVTKSKEEPKFRKEPRSATWFEWKAPAWKPVRTVIEEGTDEAPRWPDDKKLALEKDERAVRLATYSVTLSCGQKKLVVHPLDEPAFLELPKGAHRKVRVPTYGTPELLPKP